jgi:hypothetical protein
MKKKELKDLIAEFGMASQELGAHEERQELNLENEAEHASRRMRKLHERVLAALDGNL